MLRIHIPRIRIPVEICQ